MKGKRLTAILCALALAAGLSACGAPAPGADGSAAPSTASTAGGSSAASAETSATASSSSPVFSEPTSATRTTTTRNNTTASRGRTTNGTTAGRLTGLSPVASLPQAFGKGYDAFALRLIQQAQKEGKNGFLSPVSVYLAMAMVANGAGGETARQLLAALGAEDMAALNKGCRDLQSLLTADQYKLANAIWLDRRSAPQILPAFQQTNKTYFGARLTVADFGEPLRKEINQWVADNTAGRITDLLKGPMAASDIMVLVNTLLFEGQWAERFDPYKQTETFHGANGDVKLSAMKKRLYAPAYYEDDSVQAVRLNFHQSQTGMLLVLPKQSGAKALDDWIRNVSAETLRKITVNDSTCQALDLTLPEFKLAYENDLNEILMALGMRDAFVPGKADFSKMAAVSSGLAPYIGGVAHQTKLEVTEKGVLAAAATGITLKAYTKVPEDKVKTMVIDRPFFCALVDKPTGAVLFGGAINQPEA